MFLFVAPANQRETGGVMAKIVTQKITQCGECLHYAFLKQICTMTAKPITKAYFDAIPDWCPLPEAK